MDPNFPESHRLLGSVYVQKGMYQEAIAEFKKAALLGSGPLALARLGHAYAISGKRGEAIKVLNELKELSKRRYVSPFDTALIYTGLGDKDNALESLEKAYEDRAFDLALLKVEPMLDGLRSDPRFQDLMRRLGLPP